MKRVKIIIFGLLLFYLLNSCCNKAQENGRVYLKYPEINGLENTYGIRVVRTKKGDFSQVIDTLHKTLTYNFKEVEYWFDFSKEMLPSKQKNQPDFIVYVEIVPTNSNGLSQDSVIYQDSISNIEYEKGRCKIENLSFEFNGVATDSREIIIE